MGSFHYATITWAVKEKLHAWHKSLLPMESYQGGKIRLSYFITYIVRAGNNISIGKKISHQLKVILCQKLFSDRDGASLRVLLSGPQRGKENGM